MGKRGHRNKQIGHIASLAPHPMILLPQYCEKHIGILQQPLNTISNAAFFLAAWASWVLAGKEAAANSGNILLIVLIISIGVGSTLFHAFPARWSLFFDVIPIVFFKIIFIFLYTSRIMRLEWPIPLVIILLFLAINTVMTRFSSLFNGSLSYAPALLILLVFGIFHFNTQLDGKWLFIGAFLIFLISLTFRTVDFVFCPSIPFGTHFMWHILNSIVLYLSVRGLVTAKAIGILFGCTLQNTLHHPGLIRGFL